ncbi:probable glutathione S-transferase GSTU6 [Triticum dicoccoides]|uniref:probable glutathione S-transferase GSTU6 n=1 Tax=Triticum dicoccoides TaxID=85692 RepID=UPI000E79C261|nr:probable glutathione S-transferase GSTU6 [Triticum dicoccoides]
MAGEGDLQLLGGSVSPFTLRVRMALHVKGVSYEYLEQDLVNKSDLLLASNPVHKKVPVLIHGGKPICESVAIVQYVDEVWVGAGVPPLLPTGPYDRAVARFWAAYVDDKLFPAWLAILRAATEEDRAQKLAARLVVLAPMEEAFSACSPFSSGGDSIGYFDLALGCQLFWFDALREMFGVTVIDEGRTPRFAAWAERFLETEAAKTVKPPMSSMLEFAGLLRARWATADTAAAK